MGPLCAREGTLFLDLPRRIVGDVHRGIAPSPRERRHRVASERLAAGDASIFARAAGDDVGVAAQIRLRLIEITRVDEKYIDGACVLADADGRTGGMRRVIKASRSARRDIPVLVKMWLRCVRAVASAIPSAVAASVRLAPAISCCTSRASAGVRL